MLSVYPACFYKEKEGGYSVVFPDLNHLSTCGDTLYAALAMAVDCLAGYLYEAKFDGTIIPTPSDIKNINPSDEYDDFQEAFVNIVTVDINLYHCGQNKQHQK